MAWKTSVEEAGDADARELLLGADVFSTLDSEALGHGDTRQEDDQRDGERVEQDGSEPVAVDESVAEAVPGIEWSWESSWHSPGELERLGAEQVAHDASEDTDDEWP